MGMSKHLMFELQDAEVELEAALDTPNEARIAAARAAVELAEARQEQWNAHLGRLIQGTDREAEAKKRAALPCIDPISEREFNDLIGHMKSHASGHIHEELGWFATENRSAVGAVILDKIDNDYSWVCFVREPDGYVCADVHCSLVSGQVAEHALRWRLVAADVQSVAAFSSSPA